MPQRSKNFVAARRREVAALFLRGLKQQEIADRLDVSRSQISLDLKAIRKEWKEAGVRDLDEAKGEELAKIDNVERTCWEEWHRSQKPQTRKSRKLKARAVGSSGPRQYETSEVVQERLGDPRYLDGVRWAIERRCKLLGLDGHVHSEADMTLRWADGQQPDWWRPPGVSVKYTAPDGSVYEFSPPEPSSEKK